MRDGCKYGLSAHLGPEMLSELLGRQWTRWFKFIIFGTSANIMKVTPTTVGSHWTDSGDLTNVILHVWAPVTSDSRRQRAIMKIPTTFLVHFPYFQIIKRGLCDLYSLCVSVYAWTNLYETWYVYYGIWTHVNGVLHKFLLSVCVCMFILHVVARQRLGIHVPAAKNAR
jgi:hypothetical protein